MTFWKYLKESLKSGKSPEFINIPKSELTKYFTMFYESDIESILRNEKFVVNEIDSRHFTMSFQTEECKTFLVNGRKVAFTKGGILIDKI